MRKSVWLIAIVVAACRSSVVDVGTPGSSMTRWMGNEANCPPSHPSSGNEPCTVREGQTCAWWFQDQTQTEFMSCTCYEELPPTTLWDCEGTNAHPSCPMVQPESGTDCFGWVGLTCPFPASTSCSCSNAGGGPKWSCSSLRPARPDLHAPDTVAPTHRIKDLSDAEMDAVCAWYGNVFQPPGHPPGIENPVDADGYARNYAAVHAQQFYSPVCMPIQIPDSYCKANMRLGACEATVAEWADCILTVVEQTPSPHGCGRYLQEANCGDLFIRPDSRVLDASVECHAIKVR